MTTKLGDRGDQVRLLQSALASLLYHVAIDGEFGPQTLLAVQEFQRARGLTPDGIVGPLTWAALGTAVPAEMPPTAGPPRDYDPTVTTGAPHQAHDEPQIEIDDGGWMHGRGVELVSTVRTQKLATPGIEGERHVEGIVWHTTDTRGVGAAELAHRIERAGDARSCHVWIDALGSIAQSASFERGTWHAGSDTAAWFRRVDGEWTPLTPAQRGKVSGVGANSCFAGIELENVGPVRLVAGQWLGWPHRWDFRDASGWSVRPALVPAAEVEPRADKAGWGDHLFTEAQVLAAIAVTSALVRRYGLTRASCAWSHAAIDPSRRVDPGPLWMRKGGHLERVLDAVFGATASILSAQLG